MSRLPVGLPTVLQMSKKELQFSGPKVRFAAREDSCTRSSS